MTEPEARRILHSAAQIREAVEALSKERVEALLLSWSEQVHEGLKAENLSAADLTARGGPAKRTIELMLKASNPRVSTMVEFATALSSSECDYELEVKLVRKPRRQEP